MSEACRANSQHSQVGALPGSTELARCYEHYLLFAAVLVLADTFVPAPLYISAGVLVVLVVVLTGATRTRARWLHVAVAHRDRRPRNVTGTGTGLGSGRAMPPGMKNRSPTRRSPRTCYWPTGAPVLLRRLGELTDPEYDGPSLLPGWDRRHVIAHVGYNARALGRLVEWARTGVPTPMYASPQARNSEIDAGATLTPVELRSCTTRRWPRWPPGGAICPPIGGGIRCAPRRAARCRRRSPRGCGSARSGCTRSI